MTVDTAWVPCEAIGCDNGIAVLTAHLDNFLGRFYCPAHQTSTTNEGDL